MKLDVAKVERVYLSWSETCSLARYIELYLSTRRLAMTAAWRERVILAMSAYTGAAPYTKADLDRFLDANLTRVRVRV